MRGARLQCKLLVLCVFYVILSVVIIAYKRDLFSPRRRNFHYPLLVATIGKLGEVVVYLCLSVCVVSVQRCRRMLWDMHGVRQTTPMWWIVICLGVGMCLSAATLAADTIVYRLLDLTTKQVIDATAPVVSGLLGVCCWWKYMGRRQNRQRYTQVEHTDAASKECDVVCWDNSVRKDVRCGTWFSMAGIVVGTVLTIRFAVTDPNTADTHDGTPWFGIILDSGTVLTASLSTLLADYILNHVGWTPFHLELVNAPFQMILLAATTAIVHSRAHNSSTPAISREIIEEAFLLSWPIMVASPILGLTGTYILKRTSVVTAMILGNIVMGLVIVVDFVYFSKHKRLRGEGWLGLVVSAVFVAAYAMFRYINQTHRESSKYILNSSDDIFGISSTDSGLFERTQQTDEQSVHLENICSSDL